MLKLNVGLSRKVGEANYGSRGASVNLELEVESALASDPQTLQDRIRSLFRLARASVDEELNGGNHSANGDGHENDHRNNGYNARRTNGRLATSSQVRAIHAIAGKLRIDLAAELRSRFGVDRPDDLSLSDASNLIDELNGTAEPNGGRR